MPRSDEKIIISASRRSDIPAFFSEWFLKRLRDGFIYPENPYNHRKSKNPVYLNNKNVRAFVFWTKYSAPLRKRLSEIDNTGIPYYFLYTLNAYGKEMEPGFPGLERRVDDFIQLSEKIGSDKTIWRYDPIIITTKFDTRWHLNKIEKIAVVLKGRAEKVIISFYTPYRKTAGRMAKYCGITIRNKNEIWNSHTAEFVKEMKNILSASGFRVQSCAETLPLREYGIMPGACIDGELINKISGDDISARKDRGQRPECLCVKSVDIGRYNTCLGGCRYCYAV